MRHNTSSMYRMLQIPTAGQWGEYFTHEWPSPDLDDPNLSHDAGDIWVTISDVLLSPNTLANYLQLSHIWSAHGQRFVSSFSIKDILWWGNYPFHNIMISVSIEKHSNVILWLQKLMQDVILNTWHFCTQNGKSHAGLEPTFHCNCT